MMNLEQAITWTQKNTTCLSTRERLKSRQACYALYQEILRLRGEVEDLDETIKLLEDDLLKGGR